MVGSVDALGRAHRRMQICALDVLPSLIDVIDEGIKNQNNVLVNVLRPVSDLSDSPVVAVDDFRATLGFTDLGTDFNGTLYLIDFCANVLIGLNRDGLLLHLCEDVSEDLHYVLRLCLRDEDLVVRLRPLRDHVTLVLVEARAQLLEHLILDVVLCTLLVVLRLRCQWDSCLLALLAISSVSQE